MSVVVRLYVDWSELNWYLYCVCLPTSMSVKRVFPFILLMVCAPLCYQRKIEPARVCPVYYRVRITINYYIQAFHFPKDYHDNKTLTNVIEENKIQYV